MLTDCARNGIFRYWEGWGNGNTLTPTNTAAAAPAIPSVDSFGNPVRPATNPNRNAVHRPVALLQRLRRRNQHADQAGLFRCSDFGNAI